MSQNVEWSLRDSHAFLLMVTSLLLLRQDEIIVREATRVIKDFTLLLPPKYLKQLATMHFKPLGMIFHKTSKVTTLYTQSKILEILNIILKARDDGGVKILREEKIMSKCSPDVAKVTVDLFSSVNKDTFLEVSCSCSALVKILT